LADVFISYNREDQHRARIIFDALTEEGLSVWWDSNLRAGESYDEVTEKNLRKAGAVVVLWSSRSVNSKWVRAEATIGERSSILVPAMIEECDRPLRFELIQAADLIRWHGDRGDPNWRTFIHDIKAAIGHQESAPTQPAQTAAGESPAGDITIENTFWTSIKDGEDRPDFEAYLSRYPHGHFADLARNRLAAIDRTESQAKQAAAKLAARSAPPPERPAAAHQPAQQAPAQRATPAPQPAPAQSAPTMRSPAPAPTAKSGRGAAIYALVGLGVVALVGGGFFLLSGNRDAGKTTAAAADPSNAVEAENAGIDNAPDLPAQTAAVGEPVAATDTQLSAGDDAAAPALSDGDNLAAEDVAAADTPAESDNILPEDTTVGSAFTDCDDCPQMTILPAGLFTMGSPESESGRFAYESPQHEVEINSVAMGTYEITFDQWAACVEDGGCRNHQPGDAGFGRGARPVIYASWADAKAYAGWLTAKTNRAYRLPTEAEWEYAARGGTTTGYWWGDRFDRALTPRGETREVGSFSANAFGLHDVLGNVSEWVEDCYVNNYRAAPANGAAVLSGDCGRRVVRGGSWRSRAGDLRVANRARISSNTRDRSLGFRVVADLD